MTEPAPPPPRHLASHVFNLVVLAIGVVALAWMLRELGWHRARAVVGQVGSWFGVIVALDLATLCLDAAATHAFMRPEARMVSYWRVLAAQVSGRAINTLTPGGALGEATKVSMLIGHAPRERAISSVVLADLAQLYLSLAVVAIGVPITLLSVDLPHELEVAVGVSLAVLAPLVVALVLLVHRGALGTVLDSAAGLRLLSGPRTAALKARLAEVDRHLREIHRARSEGTALGLVFVGVSRLCSWTALATLLHAVGVGLTPTLLIGVVSVGVLIGWAASLVPLGLGVADGSNYLLYDVLGASGAHGVFMTLLGRARSLAMALLGLTVMAVAHTANRISIARRRRRFRDRRAQRPGNA